MHSVHRKKTATRRPRVLWKASDIGFLFFGAARSGNMIKLLSPNPSRPEQDRQHDRPDDAPSNPRDVRMSRLPFENALVKGHLEYLLSVAARMNLSVATRGQFFNGTYGALVGAKPAIKGER